MAKRKKALERVGETGAFSELAGLIKNGRALMNERADKVYARILKKRVVV